MIKRDEVKDAPNVVMGIFFIQSYAITMLFDSSAIHSFVTPSIIDNLKLVPSLGSPAMSITILTGDIERCEKLFRWGLILG